MSILNRLSRHLPAAGRGDRTEPRSRLVRPRIEPLEGRAVPAAIATPPIFQNPFMAPNNFSEIHLNSYQTDTFSVRGPGSVRSHIVQQGLIGLPSQIAGTIAFNARGQILTIRAGPVPTSRRTDATVTLLLIDPITLSV